MNETPEAPKNNGPHLELPADLEPAYSNLVRISHSPAELVFDFACLLPDQPSARVLATTFSVLSNRQRSRQRIDLWKI